MALYLVPNLLGATAPEAVLPEKTLTIARNLTHWIVETPKPARAFLKTLALPTPIAELSIAALPEKPNAAQLDELLAPAFEDHDLGLLSDAGCPGVADPGAPLIARAHHHQIPVRPLVGPSSLLLALMASGMNGQQFSFHGYLPIAEGERAETLKRLERDSKNRGHATHLFIETPYRNQTMLNAAVAALAPDTWLCIAVDLSTEHETIVRLRVRDWKTKLKSCEKWQKRPAIFLLQA